MTRSARLHRSLRLPSAALATFAAAVLAFGLGTDARAGSDDHWIHISVDGTDEKPERVRVNLPLTLITALEPLLAQHCGDPESIFSINGRDMDREDLLAILKSVKSAKDGEFITVDDDTDHVRISKEKGVLYVRVREKAGKGEKGDEGESGGERVDLQVPIVVVEALVSGTGDELDLGAALKALVASGQRELVSVDDDGERVRIWIDDKNTSD
jgi:hypothetical protein